MKRSLILGLVVALVTAGTLMGFRSIPSAQGISLGADSTPLSIWIVGEIQGPIAGSSEQQGREDSSDVFEIEHHLVAPVRSSTGLPTGKRVHTPLRITKTVDKASPKLYQALSTGERLTQVELKWYRIDPLSGEEVVYFTTTLTDAYIVDIREYMPLSFVPANESYRHMEEVLFSYGGITWTFDTQGIVVEYATSSGEKVPGL